MACDGNAGCSDCAVNGCVGVNVRRRLGAGGTVCGAEGGSGGGGGRVVGSVGLGSSVNGDREAGSALCVLFVLCGAGWSGGAYEI